MAVETTPDEDSSSSSSNGSSNGGADEEPPKPVSSAEEDDDDDEEGMNDDSNEDSSSCNNDGEIHQKSRPRTTTTTSTSRDTAAAAETTRSSRLLSPYRSVGVIIDGGSKFTLSPHQNSAQGMVTCGIGNRFHMLRTERLQPVLVSQSIVGTATMLDDSSTTIRNNSNTIRRVVVDSTTTTALAVHGMASVTLFQQVKPIQTIRCNSRRSQRRLRWEERLVELVSMGHIRRVEEPTGRTVNHLVTVAVLRIDREEEDEEEEEEESAIPVVGEDDDSDTDDSSSHDGTADRDDDSEEGGGEETIGDAETAKGVLVVLVSSRDNVKIQRRIYLPSVRPLTAIHPATYLNKLLVGGQGGMCLVNIRSGQVLHDLTCLPPPPAAPTSEKEDLTIKTKRTSTIVITAMEQAPAVDTVAIGTSNGLVHLVNLKFDKLLFSLRHSTSLAVTSLSFRTDASALHYGIAPLAVALKSGTIFVWDLNQNESGQRTVLCEMKHAQAAQMQYYPQEPLMIVASPNALQMYIFDQPDHSPRLLRQRSGHTQPPTLIRYRKYGTRVMTSMDGTDASCCQIISASAGSDRSVRMFSTVRTVLDREFSQGPGLVKKAKHWNVDRSELLLPPTTALAVTDDIREWGNMVTIHEHHSFAYVWSTQRLAQSGPILRQTDWKVSTRQKPPPPSTHATALTLSACGNFALVGTRGGVIYKYNIQSGLPRGSFPKAVQNEGGKHGKDTRVIGNIERTGRELEKKLKTNGRASNLDKSIVDEADEVQKQKELHQRLKDASHEGHAVTGLCVNAVNRTLLSIGLDGKLILWSMESHAPHRKSPLKFSCGITKLCHFRESDLAALAMQDCSILIFDCSALIVVRRMGKVHDQTITDLAFSPDGRTLYSSSLDGTMRAWDIPTNTCVDWIAFRSPPTSIAISPTGEFVGTTHVGKLGINLWSDKTYYQTLDAGGRPPTTPCRIDEPDPMTEAPRKQYGEIVVFSRTLPTSVGKDTEANAESAPDHKTAIVPKAKGLVTLSGLPRAHWKNLFHLELVKERNKPKEPPKKPPSAPFFLQWRKSSIVATDQTDPLTAPEDKDEWEAVWSDEEDEKTNEDGAQVVKPSESAVEQSRKTKRRKVVHHRSHMATLLKECSVLEDLDERQPRYQDVTDYLATLGPSAIDVELNSLCNGMHDVDDGLPLLFLGSQWLQEACESKRSFEAVNAYMNRFLHLHGEVIVGIENGFIKNDMNDDDEDKAVIAEERSKLIDSIARLKVVQKKASDQLRAKVEQSLCLVRHFSRIV